MGFGRVRALGWAVGIGISSASPIARAQGAPTAPAIQPAPTANETKAESRFREGSDAFDQGRVDQACADFAESLRLFATLGTLLNLALCHEKQGKTATAWTEFVHAAASAIDPAQRDRREFARQHAAHLERSLVRLRIAVEDASPV